MMIKKGVITERLSYWDNIKGVLIFLVVFAHCLYAFIHRPVISHIVYGIYYFHMPAFVFVSGFFSKSKHSNSARPIVRLLTAYFLLNAVHLVIAFARGESLSLMIPYYSSWYLLALVVWRLITPYFSKFKWAILFFVILSLFAGFWPDIDNHFAFARIIGFYPFFLAGYHLSKENAERISSISMIKRIPLGILSFSVAAGLAFFSTKVLRLTLEDLAFFSYSGSMKLEVAGRISIYIIASLCIIGLMLLIPRRPLPFVTKAGKNCLAIYLIHRPITLLIVSFILSFPTVYVLLFAFAFAAASCILLGSDLVSRLLNTILDFFTDIILSFSQKSKARRIVALVLVFALLSLPIVNLIAKKILSPKEDPGNQVVIYRTVSAEEEKSFDDAFELLFAGDLILLEDQVKNGYTGSGYDFSGSFEYTKKYIESADYAIGVFEGPCAGNENTTYSSGNFTDSKKFFVNYPDEWAEAVKNAGFDLVSTCNNHTLDRGKDGALRTLSVLKNLGLDSAGSYSSPKDNQDKRVKIVEKDGLKMAFLSYTYGCNDYSEQELFEGENSYITSLIVNKDSKYYNQCLETVKNDFATAQQSAPDLIVVMPHWGTQFADEPDSFQLMWEDTFKELGADIILGDHTHSVQPVKLDKSKDKSTFTLYCPGNYANLYREYNGDCSALVKVYISKDKKEVIGGSIIPMWTESAIAGNYRPLPIYEILTNEKLGNEISTYDLERVEEAQKHISKVMLNTEIDLNLVQAEYRFDENGFFREKCNSLEITEQMKKGVVYPVLKSAGSVCFVGDSITEGTKNGGVPWYEPLDSMIDGAITNFGWGSATVKTLLKDHIDEITSAKADLFVIAIGTNDIRYRDEKLCAMTKTEYIDKLAELREAITRTNPQAKFVFIAPWTSTDGDLVSRLPYDEKIAMNKEYADALESWSASNKDIFVNPNTLIENKLKVYPDRDYLVDFIHPNATKGVLLYSEAVLSYP